MVGVSHTEVTLAKMAYNITVPSKSFFFGLLSEMK
jgi:hypothetical protein